MVKQRNPQTPTFLEGTPGFYVKRENPPQVPSTAPAPSKAEATGTKPTPRSLSGSTVSLINPTSHHTTSMNATELGSSTPALIASNLYASAASIATDGGLSLTPTKNPSSSAFSAITNFSHAGQPGSQQDVGRRRLSHTPIRPKRRAAPRHELSSHSFNNPPSSYSQKSQIGFPDGLGRYSAVAMNSNAVCSGSGQGFPHTKIESISKQFKKHNVSTSLQSLSSKSLQQMGSPIFYQNSVQWNADLESKLPLPSNWDTEITPEGICYYVDHNTKRTHWIHPLAQENLVPGWIKIFDEIHGVVYYNDVEKRSQYEHPGLIGLPSIPSAQVLAAHPTMHTSPSVHQILQEEPGQTTFVEDLNIIENTAVPEWIRMYSEAPFEADHLLNWKMFKLPQLEHFDEMLMKLYKQDAINTVIKYERPRREINQELARRISS